MKFCKSSVLTLSVLGAMFMFGQDAQAAGLDFLHKKVQEGNRVCFATHEHFGRGQSAYSQRDALRKAIVRWQGYTAAEYGSEYGRYSLSSSKKASCKYLPSRSGGIWQCDVQSRPCRFGGLRVRRHR